jgi:hypothetical protein
MSDEEDDPFEQFDEEVGDRTGDPFDSFDEPTTDDEDETTDSMWEPDREEQLGGGPEETRSAASSPESTPEAGTEVEGEPADFEPVSDPMPDSPVGESGEREGDPFESAERAFERMNIDELDADDVWEALSDAEQRGSVSESHGRTYAEVSKHSYCEHCEFFSAPPDVACGHEGTEILEFSDLETVRVVDCPVVAERRELEDHE